MRLGDLIDEAGSAGDQEISSIAYDTRRVEEGGLFFCVKGFTTDGHDLAGEAVERGAAALVVERDLDVDAIQVKVPSVRMAMGGVASRFFGHPSRQMDVVGVTGTNGKTTSAFLVRGLAEASGMQCGLLGTVETVIAGERSEAKRTTPEAIDLQLMLRQMADGGDRACAMEVSSHALELGRVEATRFAVAMYTNLSQDHLDFHGSMEAYWAAKRRLFLDFEVGTSVINIDDEHGALLAGEAPNPVTCSLTGEADWTARIVDVGAAGTTFDLSSPQGEARVTSPLFGEFNVSNVLGAAACAAALGVDLGTIASALASAGQVPGRFQSVAEGQPFKVIVDYAHTPDSLENVLITARGIASGRTLCVFGCGGDRDRGKRPLMGETASRLADRTWITSDNPRSESPEAIVREVAAGAREEVQIELDRRAAIHAAVSAARPGDVVLIAGKGHEQGQEFEDGRVVDFDDVTVAREAILAAGSGA